jgi:HK97 family phage major capsid protein
MALSLDQACFWGDGDANTPLGVINTPGINTLSFSAGAGTPNGMQPNWDTIVDAIYEMQEANAADPSAIVFHPRTGATLNKLKDSQGRYLNAPQAIAGIPRLTTTSFPINETAGTSTNASSMLVGDFSQAMLGIRQSLVIEPLTTVFAGNLQVGFLAHLRADVAVAHPVSFTHGSGLIPSGVAGSID